MKKLLTLVVLVAGVAVFAGCMNKPATDDTVTPPTPIVDEVPAPIVDEVAPAVEPTTGTEAPTPEVAPTPTAE
ncbi:MAG: hypothetical protein WCL18_06300 [bacterium]